MSRDDDQVWAELVESFHSSPDGDGRQWPAAENVDPELSNTTDDGEHEPAAVTEASRPDALDSAGVHQATAQDPEGHFVPPTPPPLPSADLITTAAWASVLGVPVFLTVVVLLGKSVTGWIGALCAAAFVGGFAVLIARLRGHDPYDPDDGAVV